MQQKTLKSSKKAGHQLLPDKIETKSYKSYMLFAGKQEIVIEHNGQVYNLRITRHNKLILTK
jgi:hemin uptake protein HemP